MNIEIPTPVIDWSVIISIIVGAPLLVRLATKYINRPWVTWTLQSTGDTSATGKRSASN